LHRRKKVIERETELLGCTAPHCPAAVSHDADAPNGVLQFKSESTRHGLPPTLYAD
jgi:hypothetical protein